MNEKHFISAMAGFIHGLYHFMVSEEVIKALVLGACTSIGGYVGLWVFKGILKRIQKFRK
jgi:membrane associated rhomboid family serine protease